MSKYTVSAIILGTFVSSCSLSASENTDISVKYDLDTSTVSLECLGNVKFSNDYEATREIINDLRKTADEFCGSPATSYKEHFSSSLRASGLYMTSAKIEFSCTENLFPDAEKTKLLITSCKNAFDKFEAKQE